MKPRTISSLILGSVAMLAVSSAYAERITINTPLPQTPDELVETFLGANSNITLVPGSIQYVGTYLYQAGISSDGRIVLTTGGVLKHNPENYDPSYTGAKTDTGSNADMAELIGVPVHQTFDQNVLTFSFTVNDPSVDTISTNFVFASDEWKHELEMYQYNDAFGFFVDGVNYAWLPDGSPVSVNNVLDYIDGSDYGYAGRTDQYSITAKLDPNLTVHTVTIVIVDVMTPYYDSAVFLGGATFSSSTPAIPEPESWAMLLAGLGLVGVTAKRRSCQK
jgi:hypothetical protein